MFKRNVILLLIAVGTICNADTNNLIKNPNFTQGFKGWFVPYAKSSDTYSIKKIEDQNILLIKGASELGKKNNYVKCSQRIIVSEVANKKFTFNITLKAIKISGKLMFSIREIDSKGLSVTYHTIGVKKSDKYDWKEFTKTFTTSPKTVSLAVYIIASNLHDDDKVQVKDMSLYSVK